MATILQTPMTELEAVNAMLAAVGDAPINSLSAVYANADMARQTLHNVNRQVQSEGWWFNTDYEVLHTANLAGNIVIASDVLKVSVSRSNLISDYVLRDNMLYDRMNNTFTIPSANLDLVRFLPFEDMPNSAREYITVLAVIRYRDYILDVDRESLTQEQADVQRTRERLEIDEIQLNKYYLVKTSKDFQAIGWSFNTKRKVTLTPNGSGVIVADPSWLQVKPTGWNNRVTIRGNSLWNLDTEDGKFPYAIVADIVYYVDWNDLPYSARMYLEILSQKQLQPSKVKAAGLHVYTASDEATAMLAFKTEDLAMARTNRIYSNYSTLSVIDRRL